MVRRLAVALVFLVVTEYCISTLEEVVWNDGWEIGMLVSDAVFIEDKMRLD